MKDLLTILTTYEGAIQDANDDQSDENVEALRIAREEVMAVLQLARRWEETDRLAFQNILDSTATGGDHGTTDQRVDSQR